MTRPETHRERSSSMTLDTLHEDAPLQIPEGGYPSLPSQEHTTVDMPLLRNNRPHCSPPQVAAAARPNGRSRSSTASSINSEASSVIIEPEPPQPKGWKGKMQASRPVLVAAAQFTGLLIVSLIVLSISIKMLLPPVTPEESSKLKIPKSFQDLRDLNEVLQIYKHSNYSQVLGSFILVYLFLQCFSVPGSMYLSMIGGALFGFWALPLVCFCVATGATLCYSMSLLLGPALLSNSSKWRNRVDKWKNRIQEHQANLISYLIVLRIAPLPPHWMVNLIAPHLGISFSLFWISTFFGVLGVSFIHVQLGMTLDEMTSSDDFHLITVRVDVASVGAKLINHGSFQWKNFFGLAGIVVAVLIPVAIRYIYASDIKDAAEAEEEVGEIALPWADGESNIPQSAQRPNPKGWKSSSKLVFLDRGSQDLSSQEGSRRTRSRSGSSPPDDPHADSESIQLKESTSKVTTET